MKLGTRKIIVAIVEAGDTLSKIAEQSGVCAERILFLNPLIKDPNLIFEGEGLTLLIVPEMPEVWFHREGTTERAVERIAAFAEPPPAPLNLKCKCGRFSMLDVVRYGEDVGRPEYEHSFSFCA